MLILDGTGEGKPYTHENELITGALARLRWHFHPSQNRTAKGIHLLGYGPDCVVRTGRLLATGSARLMGL